MTAPTDAPDAIAPIKLYVRRLPGAQRRFEALRLDAWGNTLLGTKLRGELATGYIVLAAVCAFEIAAWTLLFNYVFQGGELTIDAWTGAAAVLGLLWGLGIFTIDRNLITADMLQPGPGRWIVFALRVGLVLGSAYLTAEPIKQLVFEAKIDERLKEEMLRAEAVDYYERARTVREDIERVKTADPEANVPAEWRVELATRRAKVVQADDELRRVTADAAIAAAAHGRAAATSARTQAWRDRERRLDPQSPATARAEAAYDRARANAREARRQADEAEGAVAAARLVSDAARANVTDALAQIERLVGEGRDRATTRIATLEAGDAPRRQFFTRLREASYGDVVVREDESVLRWKRAGVVERRTLLADLRDGRPPRWPRRDPAQLAEVADLFGLPHDFDAPAERGAAYGLWWTVLLVAAAIPLLSVFYKLTTSAELKLYYSVDAQASEGNADALVLCRARQARESRRTRALGR